MIEAADTIARWRAFPDEMVRELFGIEPDPWQVDALRAFPNSRRLAMKACAGPGKAQPKDTMVPTPTGLRRFGDLAVGDQVFTADGSTTEVTGIYDRGILPVYRVAFDDGCSTLACGEHLWRVRGRTERRHFNLKAAGKWTLRSQAWCDKVGVAVTADDGYAILTTEEIIARNACADGKRRQFEIPRQGEVQFPKQALPLDPYVLGIWLGDGVRRKGAYATKPTPEIQQEIGRRGFDTRLDTYNLVTVYGITGALRDLGLFDLYSSEKFVPPKYLIGSVEQRRDLLRGLMDTDGGVDQDGHTQFSSTSDRLIEDVAWLVRSLGGAAWHVKTKQPFYYNDWREKIDGKPCHRLALRLPFNPFLVPQRQARWRDPAASPAAMRYMTRFIDSIEPAGEADCMCIAVAHDSHLYLTNDFIVTHNTAVLSWIGWNFLLTRPHPMIGATSISGDNLKAALWTEMARWRAKSQLLEAMFEQTKTEIYAREHRETWRMEARTWAKDADAQQIGNALAGIHSPFVMWLLDESGDYPEAIMPVCEGIFNGAPVEAHIVQAGNPTQLSGPLYRACTVARKLWVVIEITADPDDPKRTPRVSVEVAREQIEQYGRDNPYVLVRIFGQFPPSAFNALIGPDELAAATKRTYRPEHINSAALIFGVDVARFGDDQSIIFPRRGVQAFLPKKFRNVDSTQGSGALARMWDDFSADAVFIDNAGLGGGGWIDALIGLGKAPVGIDFGGRAHDAQRYHNRRAEMYFDLVQWIKRGGAIPDDPALIAALTQTTYTFSRAGGAAMLLEPKESVKKKLGYSPDEADALALTFAEPVSPKRPAVGKPRHQVDYDPFASLSKAVQDSYGKAASDYDPFKGM